MNRNELRGKQRGWKTLFTLAPTLWLSCTSLPPPTPDPAGNWDQLEDPHQLLTSCCWAGSHSPGHWLVWGQQKPLNASGPPSPLPQSGEAAGTGQSLQDGFRGWQHKVRVPSAGELGGLGAIAQLLSSYTCTLSCGNHLCFACCEWSSSTSPPCSACRVTRLLPSKALIV